MWVECAKRAYFSVQCVWGKLAFELDGVNKLTVRPLGSCVLLDPTGLWLTNAHVVLNSDVTINDSIHVMAQSKDRIESLRAEMHNVDPATDLALIKTGALETVRVPYNYDGYFVRVRSQDGTFSASAPYRLEAVP